MQAPLQDTRGIASWICEESERPAMSHVGPEEEDDMFAAVLTGAWRRSVWLGINLLTAFLGLATLLLIQKRARRKERRP